MNSLQQIVNAISLGLVTLDPELRVQSWNRWMALHSGIAEDQIVGSPLFQSFPRLNNPVFLRNCKAILKFGNFAFFSQKFHRYLFPFKPPRSVGGGFQEMQQSCVMGPIRGDNGAVVALFLVVQDVTELVAYEKKLTEMNMRDGLTGVFNRRYLDHRLKVEFDRFRRFGRTFSLLVLDIDHFKGINDRHGHPCGDAILKAMAEKLSRSIRSLDVVARYGGEEFCCVLTETPLAGALVVGEKVRASAAEQRHRWQDAELQVTISVGIAEARQGMAGPADLVARADAGLYAAKKGGRNRVVALD